MQHKQESKKTPMSQLPAESSPVSSPEENGPKTPEHIFRGKNKIFQFFPVKISG